MFFISLSLYSLSFYTILKVRVGVATVLMDRLSGNFEQLQWRFHRQIDWLCCKFRQFQWHFIGICLGLPSCSRVQTLEFFPLSLQWHFLGSIYVPYIKLDALYGVVLLVLSSSFYFFCLYYKG